MITRLASSKINWSALLFGLAALSIGGLISLLVIGQSNNLIIPAVVVGLLALLAFSLKPAWAMSALQYSIKSEWSLLFLVFMIYTHLSDVLIKTHGLPSIAKPYVALLVLIILAQWFLYKNPPRNWERATLCLGSFVLVVVPSFLYAEDVSRVLDALTTLLKDAIIVVIITIMIQRTTTLRHVIWTLLAAGIFMGTLSTYQQLTGTFDNNYWGFSEVDVVIDGDSEQRIAGPKLGPNVYAQFMLVLVPLAMDRMWNERKRYLRVFASWALVVSLLTIVFTFSRGAFLGLVVVLAITFILRPPKPMTLLLTVLIAAALLQYIPTSYTDRMTSLTEFLGDDEDSLQDKSFRGRLSENLSGWMMFSDHPFFGVGYSNYKPNYQDYSRQLGLDRRREARSAHSMYLEYASELGLLGLGWFVIFVGVMFSGMRRAWADFQAAGMKDYASMVIAFGLALISFFITSIFLHVPYPRYVWLIYGIALAMPYVARRALEESTNPIQSE